MTIFELVKVVLADLYKQAVAQYGNQADALILQRMQYLQGSYLQLNSPARVPVDYSDPTTRFAYIYKYVSAHGDYIVQILRDLKDHLGGPIFSKPDLFVSSIGGGPGSDIVGVLKYLDRMAHAEPIKRITTYTLDKEQAWGDTWTELNQKFDMDVNVHSVFQPFNVVDQNSWRWQKKFLQADLFTLSYFVSEIKSLDTHGQADAFWTTLLAESKPGALIVYDDNGHTDFTNYFDVRWKSYNFECIVSADNVRFTPSSSEQASELQEYRAKFGQMPKLQGQLTYRVLRKIA